MWKLGDAVDAVITNAAIPIDREIPVINNGITSVVINDGWNRLRWRWFVIPSLRLHHAKNGLSRHHANHARTRWPGATK